MFAPRRVALMLPLSLVLAVVGGCSKPKGVEVAAVDLVPDASQIALGFQVDPIKSSALSGPLWQAIESDPDMSGIANALPTCEIKTEGLKGLIAGNIDGDDMMIVIESPGVGNEKAMDCLEKELAKADGEEPGVVAFETHGKVRRAPQEGGGWVVILNPNAVLIVEGAWEDEVFERIDDPDKRKHGGPLGAALSRVDTNAHVWGAMQADDSFRADMSDVAGADGLQDVAMTVDLSDGMQLDLGLEFSDGDKASAFNGAIAEILGQAKPLMVAAGVPQTAADSLKFEVKDAIVDASMKVDAGDMAGLAGLAGQLGG